jgi:butyrate kinase
MELSKYRLLAINPGSTSTKVAVFEGEKVVCSEAILHDEQQLALFHSFYEQLQFRVDKILEFLNKNKIDMHYFSAIVSRGGLLPPCPGGTTVVNQKMCDYLEEAPRGEHACNLGAVIAKNLADKVNIPSYIVDPVVVDELEPVARISGLPQIPRTTAFHALNQKGVARAIAKKIGKNYDECYFIVAHIGGGVSVGAHKLGKIIDVNNGLDGEGPMSPGRSGGLVARRVVELTEKISATELKKLITGKGGLIAHLGSSDVIEIKKRIERGDEHALLILKAMAYQISKEIGSCAAVLKGKVDRIILTGGIAHYKEFVDWIIERVSFIAPVEVVPGEEEMLNLAMGALRVLAGKEKPLYFE